MILLYIVKCNIVVDICKWYKIYLLNYTIIIGYWLDFMNHQTKVIR